MLTVEEIRTEWKTIRSELGNLICYIEGKTAQLGEIEQSWQKGYDAGYKDGHKQGLHDANEDYSKGYAEGLEFAWEIACRIVQMDVHKLAEVFFEDVKAVTHDEPFMHYSAHDAIQKLKEYDDAIMHQVTHSNAQKFVEVFGFAPGYEILDDGREVYPSLNDEFWNAEYKNPTIIEAEDGE